MIAKLSLSFVLLVGVTATAGAQTNVAPKAVVEQRTDSLKAYAAKHPKQKTAAKTAASSAKSKTKPAAVSATKGAAKSATTSSAKSATKGAAAKRSDKMAFTPAAAKRPGT